MKLKNIFIYTLAGLCAAPVAVNAQVTLSDKTSQKVDLGYGVQQSEFLTTAAATTITAEELRRTSAISLADALYGKLLGLNAFQNTGFKGEEGRGATFNIRGIQTTAKNGTQMYRDGQMQDIPGEAGILILVDGIGGSAVPVDLRRCQRCFAGKDQARHQGRQVSLQGRSFAQDSVRPSEYRHG